MDWTLSANYCDYFCNYCVCTGATKIFSGQHYDVGIVLEIDQ